MATNNYHFVSETPWPKNSITQTSPRYLHFISKWHKIFKTKFNSLLELVYCRKDFLQYLHKCIVCFNSKFPKYNRQHCLVKYASGCICEVIHSLCPSISVSTGQDFRIKEKNGANLFIFRNILLKHFSF